MENLTPMMKQYLEIKSKYKDSILFFRLGDFYEMFFEDAIESSKLLDITLTGKACGNGEKAPMCGVPFHSAKNYIQKLISLGKKVAICEQTENPKDVKGIVKREVLKVITPGTVLEDYMINDFSNNYILCALYKDNKIDISYVDVSTGEVNELSYVDSNELSSIFFSVNPSEIIANEDFYNKISKNEIKDAQIVNNFLDENNIIKNKTSFNEKKDFVNKFELESESESLQEIYYYIFCTQKMFDINSFYKKEQVKYMGLDYFTLRNLEIVETNKKNNLYSLFWVLNKTQTSMGSRLLKKILLKPSNNEKIINERLDFVGIFFDDYSFSLEIMKILNGIYDLERISNRIIYDTVSQKDLLNLKKSLILIKELKILINEKEKNELDKFKNKLNEIKFDFIINLLEDSIEEMEDDFKNKFKIKSTFNEKLSYYRNLIENSSDILLKMEIREKEKTGIKNLKINYNKVFGYYIEISKVALQNAKIPEDYERRQTLVSSERFINDELKKIEEEMVSAQQSEINLENQLYKQVKDELKKYIKVFMNLSEIISYLDVCSNLARIAIENDYVRPIINENNNLIIKNGRHPVIEKIIPTHEYVPNDIEMCNDIHIITGPNMAGKSTYMRQVAIIILMAHIGSFVPASFASIPIVDNIFTRIGANDDLTMGQSTFMVEMMEVSNILKNATENSFVILDEIGRGTSTYDGMSLAFSIVEYISEKIKAKTLVSTHYHELTDLEKKYSNISNYCMLVDDKVEIKFLRKIIKGKADKSYGIHVAQLANLPYEVLEKANIILNKLESNINKNKNRTINLKENQISIEDFAKDNNLKIVEKIKNKDLDELSPKEALNYLYDLKNSLK